MKLFCKIPFSRISIDNEGNVWPACCPDWVKFPFGNVMVQTWDEIWNGEAAKKFKDSMLDGSLRYCDKNWCPHIADATAGIKNPHVVPFERKHSQISATSLKHVNLNYDLTCNLRCPSCRSELIHIKGKELDRVQELHQFVENNILPDIESIALTGVGDPFMSKIFRKFLQEFETKKYPNIKKIHFHTNGLLFSEEMYNKMKGIHSLDISLDISVDAASENVYKKVRPPGNWNTLMANLEFIKKLANISELGLSMVVQKDNFHEMHNFIELGADQIVGKRKVFVEFKRLRYWDSIITLEQYQGIGLEFVTPLKKIDFMEVVESIEKRRKYHSKNNISPQIRHNLQEFVPNQFVSEKINDGVVKSNFLNITLNKMKKVIQAIDDL